MSIAAEIEPFDLAGPLPRGVTVLEASAGTGKTYAITGLAARYVAEGMALERILLVTFTRMATGELRERVRERLLSVERGLRQALFGFHAGDDPVVALIAGSGSQALELAAERVRQALSDFDAATIATTHGFCQEALAGLGIAADLEPGVQLVEDLSDLVSEVLDDLYVRRFHRDGNPPFTRAEALAIARIAVANPDAPIAPARGEVPAMRVRLAERVRAELEQRKRRLGVMTYDDLLMTLRNALDGPDRAAVAARLRERYEVVLVDEFQDTDPVQWEIMRLAFARDGGTLVLIADPKQAIYAFRGADVYAYLRAAEQAQTQATLTVNRRSDQQLLDAYDALFGNAKLGHEGIVYRRARAAGTAPAPRLHGAPLRVRLLEREAVACTPSGFAQTGAAREHIAADLAGDLTALLSSDARVADREDGGADGEPRPVCPGDVAVLVRTNHQAQLVVQALGHAGIPAVINGAGSVFSTDSARSWLSLLEALEQPASIVRAHAAALTPFIGWPAVRVAEATEAEWEDLHQRLHAWAGVLRSSGVASLLAALTREEQLAQRVLAKAGGERQLTDIRHIGQLLHGASSEEHLGTTALAGWLRRRMLEAEAVGDEERSRRLESDAQAVQVLTIHRSKGLEFPIVYLPYLWYERNFSGREPVSFHDPAADHERTLDVSLQGADFGRHRNAQIVEQRGEDLRLMYVALTRARHQAVIWWAGSYTSGHSPLGRLVFLRGADGTVPASGNSTPSDKAALETFATLAAQAPGRISVERVTLGLPASWSPPLPASADLGVAQFERTLDRRWRRTSYSDITAGAHDARVASEPEESTLADEPECPVTLRATGADVTALAEMERRPSLLAELPIGAGAGTLVHQTLEHTDFAAADLDGELRRALAQAPGRRAVALGEPDTTVAGLRAAIETPLGPLLQGRCLRDFARPDRLDELAFELPLAGGDEPAGALTLDDVRAALLELLAPGDPFHAYAGHLGDEALRQSVRGYLTGSIDLIVRIAGKAGPRFAVIDYKTNWLAEPDAPLTAWHYRPQALIAEMHRRHYCLQALLYLVALHRYLRWRLPGYEPERDIAGVLYLFVRGMDGAVSDGAAADGAAADGTACGVLAWQPPAGFVRRLSDLLDGETGA